MMILTLEIVKIERGTYEVHCEGRESATCHDSISAALLHYGQDIPSDFARFVEVRYRGVSLGTTAIARLAKEPEAMARELTSLVADVYQAAREME